MTFCRKATRIWRKVMSFCGWLIGFRRSRARFLRLAWRYFPIISTFGAFLDKETALVDMLFPLADKDSARPDTNFASAEMKSPLAESVLALGSTQTGLAGLEGLQAVWLLAVAAAR
jgi:hypothetical protein